MKMNWQDAQKKAEERASGDSIFVRLSEDGDRIVGVFLGEPCAREIVWTGTEYQNYDPAKHPGERPQLKIALNFFIPADGSLKIIEGGPVWFKDVLKVRDKYGLDKWTFEVQRHGAAKDPKTTYSILPEENVTPEMREQIASLKLHDIDAVTMGKSDTEEKPVDKSSGEKDALIEELRKLPGELIPKFLDIMGVKKVKDITDIAKAKRVLSGLQQTEVDPFA